jgi:hypothetical protein
MQFGLLALIGISLAAMFFGYFFGLFEGRGQGYKKRKKEEASDPSSRTAVQEPLPPPSPPAVAKQAPDKSLLRLALDDSGQPRLDLDGVRVNSLQLEPNQRRRLIDLMLLMRPWVEGKPAQPSDVHAPAPGPAAPLRSVPPAREFAEATPTPIITPPEAGEPISAPTTMVGQIDAILQKKLTGTVFANRGIRLVESAQGGAMVVIGLQRYEGVGEVPDGEIQAMIRAAIAEWEAKYTPS